MNVHMRRPMALAVATLLTLSGCGSDNKAKTAQGDQSVASVSDSATVAPSSNASEESVTDLPSDDDLLTYFNALSTNDVDALQSSLALTEEGSVAEAYANYVLAVSNAAIDGGAFSEGSEVEETEDGYKHCDDPTDDSTCVEWANIEGRNGRIVTFTANGEPVRDRIVAGNAKPIQAGSLATVTFLYAYKSLTTPNLNVVFQAKSGPRPVTLAVYDGTYRTADGRQLKAGNSLGPTDLGADSSATLLMQFPQAELGGTATFSVFSEDFMSEEPVVITTK